jgi:hypothetical protein
MDAGCDLLGSPARSLASAIMPSPAAWPMILLVGLGMAAPSQPIPLLQRSLIPGGVLCL